MKQESHIEHLIKKFNEGNITQKDLALLIHHFKEHEPENELLDLYQKTWDNASVINNDIASKKIYASVIKKISSGKSGLERNKNLKTVNTRFLVYTLKYAAVFTIAFVSSWLLNNQLKQENPLDKISSFQTIEVPYGSKTKLELPDGSKVVLNSGSKLKYETGFGSKTRIVFLEGEAFFDVKKDKNKPFYVNVSEIKIKVLGTSFNVKAYLDERTIETTLVSGSLEIYNTKSKTKKPMTILNPNQKALYERETAGFAKVEQKEMNKELNDTAKVPVRLIAVQDIVKTELSIAWKDDKFVFDNERFSDLITKIERWYNVQIELNYPALKDARFSGKFDKETVEQAMEALTYVTPFHFDIIKNKITIYK